MMWNPWHGCHKCSPGCQNCYVYYLDGLRDRDAGVVTRSRTAFYLPLSKDRQGSYKVPSGYTLATCFTSDFFIEEADEWRGEAWAMIRRRPDVRFVIPTKRIHRFDQCRPSDWGDGYDNVTLAVSCENQAKADERLPIFLSIPAKHRQIFASPILESIDFEPWLASGGFELVSVGGESYAGARVCDFDWVRGIKRTCDRLGVAFDFHQTGSNFVMDGRRYRIRHRDEHDQAKKGMEYLERESRDAR